MQSDIKTTRKKKLNANRRRKKLTSYSIIVSTAAERHNQYSTAVTVVQQHTNCLHSATTRIKSNHEFI